MVITRVSNFTGSDWQAVSNALFDVVLYLIDSVFALLMSVYSMLGQPSVWTVLAFVLAITAISSAFLFAPMRWFGK